MENSLRVERFSRAERFFDEVVVVKEGNLHVSMEIN